MVGQIHVVHDSVATTMQNPNSSVKSEENMENILKTIMKGEILLIADTIHDKLQIYYNCRGDGTLISLSSTRHHLCKWPIFMFVMVAPTVKKTVKLETTPRVFKLEL